MSAGRRIHGFRISPLDKYGLRCYSNLGHGLGPPCPRRIYGNTAVLSVLTRVR